MGAYQQLYFGPFLEIPRVKGIRTETFKKCENANCKCKKRIESKWCPECGEKTTPQSINHDVLVSAIPEDLDYDLLYPPHNGGSDISSKRDWLLPNTVKGTPFQQYVLRIHENKSGPIEVSNDADLAIAAFKEYHKDIIKQIESNGGEVFVKFGLFIHYS
jgi:hypothetical protein